MRRSGCAVKMISPASCVVGVYYVPTPRDGAPNALYTPNVTPSRESLTSKSTWKLRPRIARASVVRAPGASPIVARCATRDYDADDAGVRARRARKKNASKREWRRFSLTRMRTVLAGACVVGKTRAEGARAA